MFLKSGPVLIRHIDSVFYTLSGLEDLQMTRLTASSLCNPCPVCGRTKDGDCRILNTGSVFCQTYADENIGTELEGYKFAKRNNDGRTGTWVPVDQWGDGTKAESFYSKRKEWVYHNRASIQAVAYVRDGIKKFQASKLPDSSVSDLIGDLLPYRYPELVDVKSVFVAEGEKCADRLWELDQPATTFNGGANGFKPERDAGHFEPDVTLILVPDRDQAGIAYMQQIAAEYPDNPKLWLRVWPEQPQYWNGKCPENHGLDIADWLAGKDSETARQMIADAISKEEITLPIKNTSRNYTEDIETLLDLEFDEDINKVLPLRREIKRNYGVQQNQIDASLYQAISRRFGVIPTSGSAIKKRSSARLASVSSSGYLHDGLTPSASICMTDGAAGTGKTMFEVEKCIACVEGRGCFDRDASCKRGNVLFIATDSGLNDFVETLKIMGYDNHAAVIQGELEPGEDGYIEDAYRFFKWAESPLDGLQKWTATPSKIAELVAFIKEKRIIYVVKDSVKTIMPGDANYADNATVAQFISMLRSTVCLPTGCTISLINHDGFNPGEAAGAKAWKENVSMRTRLEEVIAPDNSRVGTKAIIVKDRIGAGQRSFGYKFGTDTAFELLDGAEIVGRCDEAITEVLWDIYREGKPHALASSILNRVVPLGYSQKTVYNTLGNWSNSHFFTKKSRGVYCLNKNTIEAFERSYGLS